MTRLGGLKQKIGAGVTQKSIDGGTPDVQLEQCREMLFSLQKQKAAIYYRVLGELAQHGIPLCTYPQMNENEQLALQAYYVSNICPLITPLAINRSHPFPFISNLSLNLFVEIKRHDSTDVLHARVKVPIGYGVARFVLTGYLNKFIRLEELIVQNIDAIFPRTDIIACGVFRVTRTATTDYDHSGAEDSLAVITSELHELKFAPVVRLQTAAAMYPSLRCTLGLVKQLPVSFGRPCILPSCVVRRLNSWLFALPTPCRTGAGTAKKDRLLFHKPLARKLGINIENDVFESVAMVCMSDLMEIASLDIRSLQDTPHIAVNNVILKIHSSIFQAIRSAGSILLQHPYESFITSIEHLVHEASLDYQVASIKMMLYRTSVNTKILDYLIDAARTEKQVAAIIELKARFDERANIGWATRLEQAGVHVSYGVVNLKTHCKSILIVRQEQEGLRRYAHIGTGNYHAGTSKLYSDIGILTCEEQITPDLTNLFNFLTTGCHPQRRYAQIIATPLVIKHMLLDKIEREILSHSERTPGLIRIKTNALEDPAITAALYSASRAAMKVELNVRDICRLIPGVKDLSDNNTVVSIVGRFLENCQIYYFRNSGTEEYYIDFADLKTRNLERRVELLIPVNNQDARSTLNQILEDQLGDRYSAWKIQSNGRYVKQRTSEVSASLSCQEVAIRNARKLCADVYKHPHSEPRTLSKQWLRL